MSGVTEKELRSIFNKYSSRRFLVGVKARDFTQIPDGIKFTFLEGLTCAVTHPYERLYTVEVYADNWREIMTGVCDKNLASAMVGLMRTGWYEN